MTMYKPEIILTRRDFVRLDAMLGDAVLERLGKVGAFLLDELARAKVVPDSDVPPQIVTMNTTIRFRDNDTGREMVVTLMYPKDAAGRENAISVLTPVGAALLGLSADQKIAYETVDGRIKILAVLEVLRPAHEESAQPRGVHRREPADRELAPYVS
jgi:regulator of nucleoside diphosphate kinase